MNGFLPIDKPSGLSSFDVIRRFKRKFPHIKKIGHTGTLDPFATGLLVLGLGEALKFINYISEEPKVYEATLKLGQSTDTLDCDGKVVAEKEVPSLTKEIIQQAAGTFLGESYQLPPMYSAKKIDGQRLYELARQGEVAERQPHKIRVDSFVIHSFEDSRVTFEVACSKGTYVRSIGEDLAVQLGTAGHLVSLRRSQSGLFILGRAVRLDEDFDLEQKILSLESCFDHVDKVVLDEAELKRFLQGQKLRTDKADSQLMAVVDSNQKFWGVASVTQSVLKSERAVSGC